jgi:hypothetical protein
LWAGIGAPAAGSGELKASDAAKISVIASDAAAGLNQRRGEIRFSRLLMGILQGFQYASAVQVKGPAGL